VSTMKTQDIVKCARKLLGITQFELAQKLGVISTTISRWERGEAKPTNPALLLLATLKKDARR
jgi:DNA-binding transcriptional regulator YiaG